MKTEIESMHCDDSRKHVITDYLLAIRKLQPVIGGFPMHKTDCSICWSTLQTLWNALNKIE